MDNVVQMNASLVEEATAAATSMAEQATGLAQAVAQFRVEENAQAPAARDSLAAPSSSTAVAPARQREPVLSGAGDDWKEF
jgi:hypothetical protein